jgi:hypothetical protein
MSGMLDHKGGCNFLKSFFFSRPKQHLPNGKGSCRWLWGLLWHFGRQSGSEGLTADFNIGDDDSKREGGKLQESETFEHLGIYFVCITVAGLPMACRLKVWGFWSQLPVCPARWKECIPGRYFRNIHYRPSYYPVPFDYIYYMYFSLLHRKTEYCFALSFTCCSFLLSQAFVVACWSHSSCPSSFTAPLTTSFYIIYFPSPSCETWTWSTH